MKIGIERCGPDAAPDVHRLTQLAFAGYGWLDPPSGALSESVDEVRRQLESGGGAATFIEGRMVGCLRYELHPRWINVRRVAVDPAHQGLGIGTALMRWAEGECRTLGRDEVRLGVRRQLPANRAFYERLGYRMVKEHSHPHTDEVTWYEMSRRV